MCFANSLATFGSLIPSLGRPDLRDLHTSAARIPDAVTTMVCGAPTGFFGVGLSVLHCVFRNAERLSVVLGFDQLVLSRTVRAFINQTCYFQDYKALTRYKLVLKLDRTQLFPIQPCSTVDIIGDQLSVHPLK